MQRDVFRAARMAGLTMEMPEPYVFEAPGPGGTRRKVLLNLVHETHHLQCQRGGEGHGRLEEAELASDEGLAKLVKDWASESDVPVGNAALVAPMGFHGDGVQYTTSMRAGGAKSIFVLSFNYLAGSARQRARRYMICALRKSACCDCGCESWHTLEAVFEVIAWSFKHLCSGRAPARRHDGTDWTPHDRKHRLRAGAALPPAALLQSRGDWEWQGLAFRFRHTSNETFCWLCDARQSGPLRYQDFTPGAAHRGTIRTHEQYMLECAALRATPMSFFSIPGFRLDHVAIDLMHAGDLGSFQDALGSLFWCEVTNKQWHRSISAGMAWLNEQIGMYLRANPHYQTFALTYAQIRAKIPGYPTLKSKAAQTRRLVGFGLALAAHHARGTTTRPPYAFRVGSRLGPYTQEYRDRVLACLQGLNAYYMACEGDYNPDQARQAMYDYLLNLDGLRVLWRRRLPAQLHAAQPWHCRLKCHLLQHLVEEQATRWGSPRDFWCYGDEGFVGNVKSIALRSRHPRTIEEVVLRKAQLHSGICAWEREAE